MPAVVFDFDGVLVDSEPLHYRAFQQVLSAQGWTLDESTYFDRYLGYDDAGLVEAFIRDRGLAATRSDVAELLDAKSRAFRALIESGASLFPDARVCVERLASRFPLAIASGALHAEIVDILERVGLLAPFRAVVAADDVSQSKPAPDCYLKASELLGVAPSDCLAIEDSRWGLAAARAAGMRTVAVTTTSDASELADADRIVANLGAVTTELVDQLVAQHRA